MKHNDQVFVIGYGFDLENKGFINLDSNSTFPRSLRSCNLADAYHFNMKLLVFWNIRHELNFFATL